MDTEDHAHLCSQIHLCVFVPFSSMFWFYSQQIYDFNQISWLISTMMTHARQQTSNGHSNNLPLNVVLELFSQTPSKLCFGGRRLVLWSGLDAGSVVLFDSGRGGQIPFEGVISEGPAVRIQFITDQPNHNTGFNIRYEGTGAISHKRGSDFCCMIQKPT